MDQRHSVVLQLYKAALRSVNGRRVVRYPISNKTFEKPVHIVSIGKAAEAMALGAADVFGPRDYQCLVINKYNYSVSNEFDSRRVTVLEASHPLPDERSLQAGRALIDFIQQSPVESQLLFLISGGASSLVEVLPEGITAEDLEKVNQWLLASGLNIVQINAVRKAMSCIKGGRLATMLGNRKTTVLLISDVPENDPAVIGSGLLVADANSGDILATLKLPVWLEKIVNHSPPKTVLSDECFKRIDVQVISDNWRAQKAVSREAKYLGYPVYLNDGFIQGDIDDAVKKISNALIYGQPGVYIWGGETTVTLPARVGRGGRNQHFALATACEIAGDPTISILVAATDGSDGPTEDAGAIVDGQTIQKGLREKMNAGDYLRRADAGTYLDTVGSLIQTGPTGTNVMDLIIGLKVSPNS